MKKVEANTHGIPKGVVREFTERLDKALPVPTDALFAMYGIGRRELIDRGEDEPVDEKDLPILKLADGDYEDDDPYDDETLIPLPTTEDEQQEEGER